MQQQPPNSEPVYVISVAARLAGLPCWVLRVLDQEEIVVPARTDSNRRLYSDEDIAVLARVRHWTEERGVNIAGVKVILEIELVQRAQMSAEAGGVASRGDFSSESSGGLTVSSEGPESRNGANGHSTSLALAGQNALAPYNSTK